MFAVNAASDADSGVSLLAAILLGLSGIIVVGAAALRLRASRVKRAASSTSLVDSMDAVIEAELQEMILETRLRASAPSAGSEDANDELELSQTQ